MFKSLNLKKTTISILAFIFVFSFTNILQARYEGDALHDKYEFSLEDFLEIYWDNLRNNPIVFNYDLSFGIIRSEDITLSHPLYRAIKLASEYGDGILEVLANNERSRMIADSIESQFLTNRSGDLIVPDFMGEIYYDINGNLVIQVVHNTEIELFFGNMTSLNGVTIRHVEFSYNELANLRDMIRNFRDASSSSVAQNISTVYIDTIENVLIVGLIDFSEENIKNFQNELTDSSAIRFIEYSWNYIFVTPFEGIEEIHEYSYGITPFSLRSIRK